jgi:hypothetical protein
MMVAIIIAFMWYKLVLFCILGKKKKKEKKNITLKVLEVYKQNKDIIS